MSFLPEGAVLVASRFDQRCRCCAKRDHCWGDLDTSEALLDVVTNMSGRRSESLCFSNGGGLLVRLVELEGL
jgi:hypothetical protein